MFLSSDNKTVNDLQIHDHACLIYENEDEWQSTVIPFIALGLERGEKCVYFLNHRSKQVIIACLKSEGIDADRYEASGQLLILDQGILPPENNSSRLEQIFEFYINFIENSIADGYPAVRFTGEYIYTRLGCEYLKNLVEVTTRMNSQLFPHYPCTALCQYDRWKTEPELLKYAIISHPIIIMEGKIYENVSSIMDDQFIEITNDRWEAEHWLSIIKRENEEREKLRQSEAKYRLIAENAYDLTILMDRHTFNYKYVSPSHERVVGYTVEELMGQYCFEHMHPDDKARVDKILGTGIQNGSGTATYRSQKKDGEYVWLQAIGKIIHEGDYQGDILLVTRDVTEYKLSEMALEKSEEKYRLIADTVQDMIVLIDIHTFELTYVSPANTMILGFSEEDFIGQVFLNFIHPEDRDFVLKAVIEDIQVGSGQVQYRVMKKDGSFIWVESIGKLFENAILKQELLVTTRDISEQKRVMEALIASEARLRNSETELKQQLDYISYLINNMNEMFLTYDTKGNITFINSNACDLVGEVLGTNALELAADSHKNMVALHMNSRLVKGESGTYETVIKDKNHNEVLIRVKSTPIIHNAVSQGAMVLAEDISEHRKMEKEMARLDQLNTIGEMAAGIGHEIRNPMTTVKGFLQIMSENYDLAEYRSYFDIMIEELERANSIVSEFLSLAKNKLVDLRLNDLNTIIKAIFPLLQADALLMDKSIKLDLKDIPELLLDEKEIRQLVVNLVRNGLEAMSERGVVYISTCFEGDEVIMSVTDEGTGIPSEVVDKLGTPFTTTKDKGTGLGLAICYSIVAHHEASIQPFSSPSGTQMVIKFKVPVQMALF
ncbi:MAG: PAS domain S-box protein [Syntrophomonadaceae bacterium]|nr:PAS domain S-box protein [Syntrophomonadaceae bacterium]